MCCRRYGERTGTNRARQDAREKLTRWLEYTRSTPYTPEIFDIRDDVSSWRLSTISDWRQRAVVASGAFQVVIFEPRC